MPTGRGGTKDCQTTGTTGVDGLAEHTFNYAVAYQLRVLTAAGAQVLMSRTDDTSVGPCVDARAEAANKFGADAAVSIHADGSAPGNRGFHVNLSSPPLNPTQQNASPVYAKAMRDALVSGGFTPGDIHRIGRHLPAFRPGRAQPLDGPVGPRRSRNMRDATDEALLASPAGQQRLAQAVASGIAAYLGTPQTR